MKLPQPKLVVLASAIAATFGGGCGDSSTLVVTPSRPSASSAMAIRASIRAAQLYGSPH